jgi:hypothetical protein
MVTDPRPTLAQGVTQIYSFGIDVSIPKIQVPLANKDFIVVDLGAAYHQLYHDRPSYGQVKVDYAQLPVHFERYMPNDQAKIQARMAVVAANATPSL